MKSTTFSYPLWFKIAIAGATIASAPPPHDVVLALDSCVIDCVTDNDCPMTCHKDIFNPVGTCVVATQQQASTTSCPCNNPTNIPEKCDVDVLIDIMETFVKANHGLISQWLRTAFHDAGTFDQTTGVGGANGCLLNHLPMRNEPENNFLDLPLNTLMDIKNSWHEHSFTCINVSSADIIQFAALFATVRQKDTPESLKSGSVSANAKRETLKNDFVWGRPDEFNCDVNWTDNLPEFITPSTAGGTIPGRCTGAGGEIKNKMMDRNGFTAEEATALIGAHSIGMTRHTMGASLSGTWVTSGADNATPFGPKFGNSFHDFLVNQIVENDATSFSSNLDTFDWDFFSWFRIDPTPNAPIGINHLDTDVTLAFPSLDLSVHPNFNEFTSNFAGDNSVFLATFFPALKKMSQLGVDVALSPATSCVRCPGDVFAGLDSDVLDNLIADIGDSTASASAAVNFLQFNRIDEIRDLAKRAPKLTPPPVPPTNRPTLSPSTPKPTNNPITAKPTNTPITAKPTSNPVTPNPTSLRPTLNPATAKPTKPTTRTPTNKPTAKPIV